MATYSSFLNLELPIRQEKYNIDIVNANNNKIDDKLSNLDDNKKDRKILDSLHGGTEDGDPDKQYNYKVLSDVDFTYTRSNKLNGIEAGAEVNVQSNWNTTDTNSDAYILNKPTSLSQFSNNETRFLSSTDDTSFEIVV